MIEFVEMKILYIYFHYIKKQDVAEFVPGSCLSLNLSFVRWRFVHVCLKVRSIDQKINT